MSNFQQVQMLKDGKRTVIIINGAGKGQDEIAYKIVTAYNASMLGIPVEVPTVSETEHEDVLPFETVEGLTPPPEPKVEVPTEKEVSQMEPYSIARSRNQYTISNGTYKGMTVLEALHKENETALVRLYEYATNMKDSGERDEIIEVCKQYMTSLPVKVAEFMTKERKCSFIKTISEMSSITPFISGYMDLYSFENYASNEEIDKATKNLAEALYERGMK